jgi:ATP/maltotriose-dependent transcriptional regulator MalT
MARGLDDTDLLSHVLTMTPYAHSNGRDALTVLPLFEEAVRTSDESGDPTRRAIARTFLSAAQLTLGDHDAAALTLERALETATGDSVPVVAWTVQSNQIRGAALAGRLDEADALNAVSLARGQELGQSDAEEWWAATALGLLWLRGQAGAFADGTSTYVERYPLAVVWHTAHAWLQASAGRVDEARAILAANDFDAERLLLQPWPYVPSAQLVLTAWELDDAELAARMRESLRPYRGCWAHYFLFVMGPVTWLLGLAAVTAGDHDEGIELLAEALTDLEQRSYPAYAAMVGHHLGVALLRRGAEGDRARAAEILRTARQRAAEVGSAGLVERIEATPA